MSRKITAKSLLKEVQSIKKQASSGFFKPAPIEYETESDLNSSIDSVLLDILDGYGFMGATDVIVRGDTAYVKGNFELELDVKKIQPWYLETTDKEVAEALEAVLGDGYRAEFISIRGVWAILGPNFSIEKDINVFELDFSEPSILDNEWIISGNEANYLGSQLSGDYDKDIRQMAAYIKKYTEEFLWWEAASWKKVGQDIISGLSGWSISGNRFGGVQIVGPGSSEAYFVGDVPNIVVGPFQDGLIIRTDELSGNYGKDIKTIQKLMLKDFKQFSK